MGVSGSTHSPPTSVPWVLPSTLWEVVPLLARYVGRNRHHRTHFWQNNNNNNNVIIIIYLIALFPTCISDSILSLLHINNIKSCVLLIIICKIQHIHLVYIMLTLCIWGVTILFINIVLPLEFQYETTLFTWYQQQIIPNVLIREWVHNNNENIVITMLILSLLQYYYY